MFKLLSNFGILIKDDRGVTALVAVVIVTSVTALGTTLAGTFTTIVAALP